MEKIESIRKGRIWLNILKTEDGQILCTVNKTYLTKDGQWRHTDFLNPRRGDLQDLMDALKEFKKIEKKIKTRGRK